MGNIINRVFESAGPDGKVRGTPQQIIDKYQALARDAQVSGDRVAAESFLQHSEHYSRILGEAQREQGEQQRFNQQREDSARNDENAEAPRQQNQPQSQPQQQPRPQPQPQQQPSVGSGLTMIDTEDSDYYGGPIETPEGNRRRASGPAPKAAEPTVQPAPAPAPVEREAPRAAQPAVVAEAPGAAEPETAAPVEAAPAPAKRPRTRRKAKVEPEAVTEPEVQQADSI